MKSSQGAKLIVASLLALLAALLGSHLASAKGEFSSVLIMDIDTGELRLVDDPQLASFIALSLFRDGTSDAPTIGRGYELTRLATAENRSSFAVDRLRYYPPGSNESGYIFYEGLINGASEYDGRWFSTTPAADAMMQGILSHPGPRPAPAFNPLAAIALPFAALLLGLVAGFLVSRRRAAGQNDQIRSAANAS